jgi:predicted alpha/beta-fold hydrolase
MPRRDFEPPRWLRNPHAQTVFGRLARPRRMVALRREAIETPDGDELLLDHLDTAPAPIHFVLMHGLEGSSYSIYVQGILSLVAQRGLSATAVNFRSCARDPLRLARSLPNRRPRFYHSGETGDFDFVVRTLAARLPSSSIVAFGASLGGNVLLKWLGEHPGQSLVSAAAALSVPYDLGAGSDYLDANVGGRIYVASFLSTLKQKVSEVVTRFPETRALLDVERVARGKKFREFDDAATGPLHGFTGADDYYRRSSSIHFLSRITTPTLCIAAEDDPFLPPDVLPRVRAAASPSVEIITTPHGGHVGFVAAANGWNLNYWAEQLVVGWIVEAVAGRMLAGVAS